MYSGQYAGRQAASYGFSELADHALRELPDPVDEDQIDAWYTWHGATRDDVISGIGGSP